MAAVANAPAAMTVRGVERRREKGCKNGACTFAWRSARAQNLTLLSLSFSQVGAGKEFATIADTPEWKALVDHVAEIEST